MTEPKKTQENTTFVIQESNRPHSYEYGKPSRRFKLYFKDPEDLKDQINQLKKMGLYVDEPQGDVD